MAVNLVTEVNGKEENNDYLDFHARRLVEMAGHIIMVYLLLNDTMRDAEYEKYAELMVRTAKAENQKRMYYIQNFELKNLGMYKK